MSNDIESKRKLTTAEAAEFLGYSYGTMVRWRKNGLGPAFTGKERSIRYLRSTLEAWEANNTFSSTAEAAEAS